MDSLTPVPGTRPTADFGRPTFTMCILEETMPCYKGTSKNASLRVEQNLTEFNVRSCLTGSSCTGLFQWEIHALFLKYLGF